MYYCNIQFFRSGIDFVKIHLKLCYDVVQSSPLLLSQARRVSFPECDTISTKKCILNYTWN